MATLYLPAQANTWVSAPSAISPAWACVFPFFSWSQEPSPGLQPPRSVPSGAGSTALRVSPGTWPAHFPHRFVARVVPASTSKALTFAIEKAQGDRWEAHN